MQNLLPFARQLAMMRLGMNLVGTAEGKAAPLFVDADDLMVLTEGMVGDASCKWYVDTDGYGMLQANEAEPPPKAETSKGLIGKLSDLKHTLTRIAAIMMLVITLPFVACHKDPVPTPTPTPTPDPQTPDTTQVDTTTIIEPTYPDTVYLDWDWEWRAPPMDSVIFFAQKNSVKKIMLNLRKFNSTGYYPYVFNTCLDTIQTRIDVNPQKVRGAGTIYISCMMPDSLTSFPGMHRGDSIRATNMGFDIGYWNKKSKPDAKN